MHTCASFGGGQRHQIPGAGVRDSCEPPDMALGRGIHALNHWALSNTGSFWKEILLNI